MFASIYQKSLVGILIISFFSMILLAPANVLAKWDDKSDELPGMTDEEMLTTVLIIAGAAVAIYFIIKLANTDESDQSEPSKENEEGAKQDSVSTSLKFDLLNDYHVAKVKSVQLSNTSENKITVTPILNLKTNPNGLGSMTNSNPFENPVITMGVSVRF